MKLEITDWEKVTPEKVLFVEEQANKRLAFAFESRTLLTQEAHTTLQWLFAIVIGVSGYIATLLKPEAAQAVPWWMTGTLGIVVALAALEAIRLFTKALRIEDAIPMGNEPKNIATDKMMALKDYMMRLGEAAQLQERIDHARTHNERAGDAINEARWFIALLLPIAALFLLCFKLIAS